jgi:hypothetical protein
MDNPEHKLVWSFKGDRNLNTNPLDTGDILNGWENDYFLDEKAIGGTATINDINFYTNGDTSTNYRDYFMRGRASSTGASASDSANYFGSNARYDNTTPAIIKRYITHESGVEEYSDVFSGGLDSSGNTEVRKTSGYRKNILDKIESIQINSDVNQTDTIDIKIYEIPKTQNLDNYDLVDEVVFENRSTDIVFDNLNGDVDEEYLIEWNNNDSLAFRINGDVSNVYTAQGLTQNGGVLSAINGTATATSFLSSNGSVRLFATSGKDRLFVSSASSPTTENGYDQAEGATWYTNTLDNVTSITATNLSSETGKVSLYKRKSNKTIDPVPMVTVVDYEVDGDFSNGITINNINGDSIDGAIKIEVFDATKIGADASLVIEAVNDDLSNAYGFQLLRGIGSAVTAVRNTLAYLRIGLIGVDVANSTTWFYPRSGSNRPFLSEWTYGKDKLYYKYGIWGNELDPVSAFTIKLYSSDATKAKIRISIPKDSADKAGSFTVTTN